MTITMNAAANIKSALIVGAGIGGMGAAIAFARRGIDVEIIEVNPTDSVLGVGINQPANSLRIFKDLGLLDEIRELGFSFISRRTCDMHGNLWLESIPPSSGDVPANIALSRCDLSRVLHKGVQREGIKISHGTKISQLTQTSDQVHVELTDGRSLTPDLVLGFDGIRSQVRQIIFGDRGKPIFTGYSVWRKTIPRPPSVTFLESYQGAGTKAGVIPLSQESMYIYHITPEPTKPYFDPADFGDLFIDRLEGYGGLAGAIRDDIKNSEGIVYSPIEMVVLPPPWHVGRTIILGDAAHACSPTLTQGAGMALEDGIVLAEMIKNHGGTVEEMLQAFEARRYPRVRFVQDAAKQVLLREMAVRADTLESDMAAMRDENPSIFSTVSQYLEQPA